jgi:hypothetical protein
MKFPMIVAAIVMLFSLSLYTQEQKHHSQTKIDCQECHSCDIPTHSNPCLKLFPDFRRSGITILHSAEDVPELLVIDTLSNEYEPSVFTHKLHAEMAAMSGGCASCHHFNPPGKILACVDCHEAGARTDLSKPGLKGAYHRQCLTCHREWSNTTNCTVCHDTKGSSAVSDKAEFIGKSHEKMELPAKVVYQTDEDENPLVTFYHDEHNELFDIGCADCHQNESCSRCHDQTDKVTTVEKDAHDNCINCHEQAIDDDDKCKKCHDTKEKKRFTHAAHGWKLNKYHEALSCNSCHLNNKFGRLSTNCVSCHKEWKDNTFEHSVTGLKLDEDHIENDCSDCHIDMNFIKKPFCNDCHDDYAWPAQKPGKVIKY